MNEKDFRGLVRLYMEKRSVKRLEDVRQHTTLSVATLANQNLKNPGVFISILQLFALFFFYEIIAFIIGIIAGLIGSILDLIPFLNLWDYYGKASDGIFYTFTPLAISVCLFTVMGFVFKKHYINFISFIIFLLIVAYLSISLVISQVSIYGIMSWEFANQSWFTVILFGSLLVLFLERSNYSYYVDMFKGV